MKKVIALLCGGISSEREVSLKSGQQVRQTLDKPNTMCATYDPKTDLPLLVKDAHQIDAALIMLHGAYGEDGTIQGCWNCSTYPTRAPACSAVHWP
jgi:D-alanine-D-alanine ligase